MLGLASFGASNIAEIRHCFWRVTRIVSGGHVGFIIGTAHGKRDDMFDFPFAAAKVAADMALAIVCLEYLEALQGGETTPLHDACP
jgi:hypothetical protein